MSATDFRGIVRKEARAGWGRTCVLLSRRDSAAPLTSSTLPPDARTVRRVWTPELAGVALGEAQITLMDLRFLSNSRVANFLHLHQGHLTAITNSRFHWDEGI